MAETKTKAQIYQELYTRVEALASCETDPLASMCNIIAEVHSTMGFLWTGIYRVENDDMLVLGPFQGPVACTRIKYGKGVCGTCWAKAESILVPDVDAFPGHIRCSSSARSEVVAPVMKDGRVTAVFDIDSAVLGGLDEDDLRGLERIAGLLPTL